MKTAIYPISADPITYGHIAVIEKSIKMFDNVVIAIGNNPSKKYLLSIEKRLRVAQSALSHLNVKVKSFDGALVDFAWSENANIVIRGLRNVNDFQYEMDLAAINNNLKPDLETCFVVSSPENNLISSSASKALIKENFFSNTFLPLASKSAVEAALNKQFIIGITGKMGSGKSYIASRLEELSKNEDIKVHNIDLDLLCHEVYNESNAMFKEQRNRIESLFGTLNRKEIGEQVFKSDELLSKLNEVFKEPLKLMIRKKIKGIEGVVLLNGATIVSEYFLPFINNNLVFIDADTETRKERCLEGRSIDPSVIDMRDSKVMSIADQKELHSKVVDETNFGTSLYFDNGKTSLMYDREYIALKELYSDIISTFVSFDTL